jgi:hypothetical protein
VVETRVFGQFSGQIGPQRDTTKRRGDTKDRCVHGGDETKNECDRNGRENTDDDRDLIDGRECALLCDALSVPRLKRNRSARPTRIGGFAKGARHENQKSDDSRRRSRQP